jgi:hypothetical protein
MWAGHLEAPYTLKKVVGHLMQAPLYPVSLDVFQAGVEFREFRSGENLSCGAVAVRTIPLNHPNGATGYRIDHLGKSICYITDTEHREGERDTRAIAAGDTRPGRRVCGSPMLPASVRWRSSITIPATTTRSWTVSHGKQPSRARALRQAACRVSSWPTKA